jgi:hypothetical protein
MTRYDKTTRARCLPSKNSVPFLQITMVLYTFVRPYSFAKGDDLNYYCASIVKLLLLLLMLLCC